MSFVVSSVGEKERATMEGEFALSAMGGEKPFFMGRFGSVSFVEEVGEEKEEGWTRLASFVGARAW